MAGCPTRSKIDGYAGIFSGVVRLSDMGCIWQMPGNDGKLVCASVSDIKTPEPHYYRSNLAHLLTQC